MSAYKYVYHMDKLSKTYPGAAKPVFQDISLHFLPDAKIGVVGVNGAGKSTLLKIMAGMDTEFTGEAWAEKGVRVGYLPQEPVLDETKTVWENVIEGSAQKQLLEKFNAVSMQLAEDYTDELMAEMTELQEQIDNQDAWDIDSKIEMAMTALRCPPSDWGVTDLSGGERRRVALCRLLLSEPHMLLLDEPTNHLDAESVHWLQTYLEKFEGAVLVVTHDRYFLDSITTWTLELDRGRGVPYEGGYSAWLEQKAKRMAQEDREASSKDKALARELEWIRSSPKARQSKSKARIKSYEELRESAEKREINHAQINIPPGPRLGGVVVEVENLKKGFEDKLLIDGLSFKLPPGGVVGVIGPNGAGKSTLFKMITGQDTPDEGTIRLGETVKLSYVDQSRDALDPNKTVWEEISGGHDMIDLGGKEVPSRAYVGAFNFKGGNQQKKVGLLSGGERNRVHLAKTLQTGGNLLLLDEPTNDLDVETLAALEQALEVYPGCAVVISHDRFFLDRLATHILAFEGDSHVEWFEGNFHDYMEDKKRRLGPDADMPKRIKFQKFAR
ncbi:energy-dependent translational throttle protein EttA [Maricaulis parjimensis]|uniref:energy-dependent translational throttle protein EttA n=1 Tax=Maricaulis parjimensis TaxID=144023 RepID=UPI00193943DF|nr:energy-dependent translational throttle protein EttA [Maricaulis parjimensis]